MTRPTDLKIAIESVCNLSNADLKQRVQSLDPLVAALIDERVDGLIGLLPPELHSAKRRTISAAFTRSLLLIAALHEPYDVTLNEESDQDHQAYLDALHQAQPPFAVMS